MVPHVSKAARIALVIVQAAALVAGWAWWGPAGLGQLPLALSYVLVVWAAAGTITLGTYLALSMAPLADLVTAASLVSANAMWLVPGSLLLASGWPVAIAAGVGAVINSMRLLVSNRVPGNDRTIATHRTVRESHRRLFRYQLEQPVLFSRERLPVMLGSVALQAGAYALVAGNPLSAAVSFAIATAAWVRTSVSRGALEARVPARAPGASARILMTLLWTATLTAALLQVEIVPESAAAGASAIDIGAPPQTPGVTRRMLGLLVHRRAAPSKLGRPAAQTVVTRVVDPGPAIGAGDQSGVPGVVLRPAPVRRQSLPPIAPAAHLQVSRAQPLAIAFTGEYELFRTSSGTLPKGAVVETGTPLERVYGTTNGGPMETIAVQTFDPPIDLTNCAKVLVALTSGETMPLLASMQLVAERSVEDGGTDLMGMKRAREETLEFLVPLTSGRLLVNAIRIAFLRPAGERDKNVRVAVERFTLVPR